MAKARAPMLFAPPQPPVIVPKSRSLRIGRTPEADLVVRSRRASREHAEVRYEGEQVVIEDLDSTNGTLVNGEAITSPRVLKPGDRIEIGGMLLHYCLVDEQLPVADAGEDTTVVEATAIRDAMLEAFRGEFGEIPLPSIMQMLEAGQKTGALEIISPQGMCRFYLEKGRPVHAETPVLEGLAAALSICQLREGRFVFDSSQPIIRRTIDRALTEILLEASRRRDESETIETHDTQPMPPDALRRLKTQTDPFRNWWRIGESEEQEDPGAGEDDRP